MRKEHMRVKRLLAGLLAGTMIFALAGCEKGNGSAESGMGAGEPSSVISGRYIHDVYTDKSCYNPKDKAVLISQVYNPGIETLEATVSYTVKHLGQVMDTLEKTVSIAVADTQEVRMVWATPDQDFTGYSVEVRVSEGERLLDYEMTAVDVSSDWNVFPRYAYLTKFGRRSYDETKELLAGLSKYHINGLFYFDHIDRHDKPLAGTPDNPAEMWTNLANQPVYKSTIDDLIKAGHLLNMKSFSYNLIFGAYPDYASVGVKTEWGIFKDPTHTEFDFHPLPSTWKASKIYLMDPANKGWQDYYIQVYKDFLSVFNFDGIQVDSLGGREYDIFDYNGNKLQLDKRYSELLDRMTKELDTKIIFNAVSEYGQDDVASKVDLDIMFAEVWPWSHKSYNSLKETVDNANRLLGSNRGVVIPAYMNYDIKSSGKEFNLPGILYTNAAIIASGGQHLELGDNGMLSSEYYPATTLKMSRDLIKATRNYYTFMTAYENVLRGGGLEEVTTRSYVNGELCSATGAKGDIWSFTKVKSKENLEVLQLINLQDVDNLEWVDRNGTQPAPQVMKNAKVKQYVQKPAAFVLVASPDYREGIMEEVAFTSGSDEKGEYIEFEIPHLEYWTMAVIQYA